MSAALLHYFTSNYYKFEIIIEKYFEIPREIFKPNLTKEQETELIEKCLRLKAAKVRGYNLQGIKWFYENYFPAEFHAHNTNKDWDK